MARIRTIKPEFFKNEQLAELPIIARMLFIGLWTLADRRGRLLDRPKRIKAEVLPYDKADADALLSDLQAAGLIIRYTRNDLEAIQILSFEKHQRITGKEAQDESVIPEYHPGNVGETPGKQQGNTRESSETTGKEGKGRERKGKEMEGKEFAVPAEAAPSSESNEFGDASRPGDSTTQPPDQKEKSCAKKEKGKRGLKETTEHWQALVGEWHRFYGTAFKLSPEMSHVDFSNLKELVGKIRRKLKEHDATKDLEWTQGTAVDWLQKFLTKAYEDPWLRDHFRLANINSQFNEIATRNAKPSSKQTPGGGRDTDYERELAERIRSAAGQSNAAAV